MKLILASQSPRRRELLEQAGFPFEVRPPSDSAECGICSGETPPELVARLARQKAEDVAANVESGLVLGCDTVAECLGQVLGKPRDEQHAREMLVMLRGREHHVYSGVCLIQKPDGHTVTKVDATKLLMENISDDEIESYIATGGWDGKAGGFGIQDRLGWIRIIEGSESNVVGLPMEMLHRMLADVGYE